MAGKTNEMEGLLSEDEVSALAPRLSQAWAHPPDERWTKRSQLAGVARFAMTHAWTAGAAVHGDTDALGPLTGLLLREIPASSDWDLRHLLRVTRVLARKPALARRQLLPLLESDDVQVQRALVDFFEPHRFGEARALERIVRGGHGGPASDARAKLAEAGAQLRWWWGHFEEDPLGGPNAQAIFEAQYRRLAALGESEEGSRAARETQIAALIGRFPPSAALSAAQPLLAGLKLEIAQLARVCLEVARHEGAPEMFLRVAERWLRAPRPAHGELTEAIAKELPAAFRERVCPLLLARLRAEPPERLRLACRPVRALAEQLAELWPATLDPRPLYDAAVAWSLACDESDLAFWFDGALRRAGRGREWLRPAFEAALAADFAGPARQLDAALQHLAPTVFSPAELRAQVLGAIEHPPGERAVAWAVAALSAEERLACLADRRSESFDVGRRVRPALFARHLQGELLARARQELRDGLLDAREAACVASAVDRIWGGNVPISLFGQRAPNPGPRNPEAASLWSHGDALAGPLDEREWTELRRLRETLPADEGGRAFTLDTTYPLGPWHPVDLRQFDRACQTLLQRKNENDAPFFACIASVKGAAEHLALLDALEPGSETGVGEAIDRLRWKLGLPERERQDGERSALEGEEDEE